MESIKTFGSKLVSGKKETKKIVKKELEGKETYLPKDGNYQIRILDNGTLMVYIKRSQKILVRLMPAIGNPKNLNK